ncbi:hypothetical protein ACFLZ7_03095 [Nanoarchaeota archaeon]
MNKKAVEMGFVIKLIIAIIGFLSVTAVLYGAIQKAEQSADPAVCRNSVFLRESYKIQFPGKTISTPLLCPTGEKELQGREQDIKKQLAEAVAGCWYKFGSGVVKDVFKDGNYGGDQECMICDTIAIKDKEYKLESQELLKYLSDTTYFIDKNTKEPITYLDYVQSYGEGTGNVFVTDVIAPDLYATIYGAPTKECGTTCKVTGWTGALGGAIVGAKVGAIGCSVVPGVGTFACGVAGFVVGGVAGGATGWYASAKTVDLVDAIKDRGIHTVYLVPLSEAKKTCVVHDG